MSKSTDVLSKLTGLTASDIQRIATEVKVNLARLDACGLHTFNLIESSSPPRTRYRCSACNGEIDGIAHKWYSRGRAHGAVSR